MSKYPDGHRYMKACLSCAEEFRTFPSEEKKGGGKFCSKQCGREFRSEQAKTRNTRTCLNCEKDFVATIGNIGKGNGKYCSRLCQNRAIGDSRRGKPRKMSAEWKQKLLEANRARKGKPSPRRGAETPSLQNEKHHLWKGDGVSYRSLHSWVVRKLGQPEECEECGTDGLAGRKIHWANISRLYKRDLNDWVRLCAKCHKAYDMDKLKLTATGG